VEGMVGDELGSQCCELTTNILHIRFPLFSPPKSLHNLFIFINCLKSVFNPEVHRLNHYFV